MDAAKLRQTFEKLDQALEHPTELLIRGGAAVLAHGLEQRVTLDIDVLPASRFIEADLRRACAASDLGFNPSDKDFVEEDYLEVAPEGNPSIGCRRASRPILWCRTTSAS